MTTPLGRGDVGCDDQLGRAGWLTASACSCMEPSAPSARRCSCSAGWRHELWGTARGAHAALIRELGATPIDYQREDFTRVLPGGFDIVSNSGCICAARASLCDQSQKRYADQDPPDQGLVMEPDRRANKQIPSLPVGGVAGGLRRLSQ